MKTNFILCLVLLGASLHAQPPPPVATEALPPQATIVRGVVVPVPDEIFKTLDRFANSNWRPVQRAELTRWRSSGDQVQNAMLLGAVIAEGFVAVAAEDPAETRDVGRAVLRLARGLGVEKTAIRRSRSIVEHAEKGDWEAVRKEWDRVLPDVRQGMDDLQSEDLAHFVALGGWLRGTEALSALILQNYSEANAQLLRQPALLDHVEKEVVGRDPLIEKMRQGLRDMRQLIASGDKAVSRKDVQEIARLSSALLKNLSREAPPPPRP